MTAFPVPSQPASSRPARRARRLHRIQVAALVLSVAAGVAAASPAPAAPSAASTPSAQAAEQAPRAEAPPPRHDHDWALQAVRAGEIRSVAEILQRLEREFLGHVVEIELQRERGRIVYEIELLSPSGHVIELVYDARTSVLISARGQGLDGARRQVGALGTVRP